MANDLVNQPTLPDREQTFFRAMGRELGPPEAKAVLADLHALARPASRLNIGEHLVILVGCFPNAKTDDAEIYGRALAEYVAATQPSVSDLEAARHKLIKTMKFRPAISEVLEALEAEKKVRLRWTDRIEYIAKSRDQQVKLVEQGRQRHQEWIEYKKTIGPPNPAT